MRCRPNAQLRMLPRLGSGASNVSLLLTGSTREYLEMMLNNSREPLFNQAFKARLPRIGRAEFHEFLAFQFEATGRKALYLLADHPDQGLTSSGLADRYGLGAHTTAKKAMPRLARRGLVERTGKERWKIIDPFLAEWLRQNSPFGE